MAPGDTKTGSVMEGMALSALAQNGYKVDRNVYIGSRFGIARHKIDLQAEDPAGRLHLVSMKWQQVGGTAEQKIPFEVICLADTLIRNEKYYKAHLVLGGDGWKYKEFYLSGGLNPYLLNADMVNIVSLDRFVTLVNRSQL